MNWKGLERKRYLHNFKVYSGIYLEKLRKTTKILSQNSRSSGPIFEPGTS
jgi:hypothetical protein